MCKSRQFDSDSMIVNEVKLEEFRNFLNAEVSFNKDINVIIGSNAQGKTTIIETIYYLATGRSFRNASDSDLISFDKEEATISCNINSANRNQTILAKLYKDRRRRELFVNDVKLKKAAELTGRLRVVLFCPEDLKIIKDGASGRRKLMDNCLCQLRPSYLAALTDFNKLYDHKMKILKNHRDNPSLLDLLDDFNYRLSETSARLITYRAAFSRSLSRRAKEIHHDFSNGKEHLEIIYKTVGGIEPYDKKHEDLLPDILKHQQKMKDVELKTGACLSGAHKDDLEVYINEAAARKFASQGQARTAAVSIKLAERDIQFDDKGEYPVLLLDDVLSELDLRRQRFILNRIDKGQVIITSCEETDDISSDGVNKILISNGKVES